MLEPSTTRRDILGRTALGTAMLSGIAGCSMIDLGSADDLPDYATWLPAPERVFLDPDAAEDPTTRIMRTYYPFEVVSWTDIVGLLEATGQDNEFEPTSPFTSPLTGLTYRDGHVHPELDVGLRDVDLWVRARGRGFEVLETNLDDDAIVEVFETSERLPGRMERVGEYEGYELLTVPDHPWMVGIRDGVIALGVDSVEAVSVDGSTLLLQEPILRDTRDVLKAIIDARAGAGRYVETHDGLRALITHLGEGAIVSGSRDGPEVPVADEDATDEGTPTPTPAPDPIAAGGGVSIVDGETARLRFVAVFEPASAATVGRVDGSFGQRFDDWNDVEVRTDGRVVLVEGTRESSDLV